MPCSCDLRRWLPALYEEGPFGKGRSFLMAGPTPARVGSWFSSLYRLLAGGLGLIGELRLVHLAIGVVRRPERGGTLPERTVRIS